MEQPPFLQALWRRCCPWTCPLSIAVPRGTPLSMISSLARAMSWSSPLVMCHSFTFCVNDMTINQKLFDMNKCAGELRCMFFFTFAAGCLIKSDELGCDVLSLSPVRHWSNASVEGERCSEVLHFGVEPLRYTLSLIGTVCQVGASSQVHCLDKAWAQRFHRDSTVWNVRPICSELFHVFWAKTSASIPHRCSREYCTMSVPESSSKSHLTLSPQDHI